MAFNVDLTIQPGSKSYTADPKWLDDDQVEHPGSDLQGVTWQSSSDKITCTGDPDIGKITIPDTSNFADGEQVVCSCVGDPVPGDADPLISLEVIFTFHAAAKKQVTHADLTVTEDAPTP